MTRRKVRGQPVGKYNAKGEKIVINGAEVWIPSATQAERLRQLQGMEIVGTIGRLRAEVPVDLVVNNIRICVYKVDAVYDELGPTGSIIRNVYEEVKGFMTADWRLKRKLFNALMDAPLSVIEIPSGTKNAAIWMRENWAGRLP